MATQLDDFLKEFDGLAAAEKQRRRTDDLMNFIRANWRLFCGRYSTMSEVWNRMGKDGIVYSLDSLCDLLGMRPEFRFKRISLDNYNKLFRDMKASGAVDTFNKLAGEHNDTIVLFLVVGEHACIITNAQTSFPETGEIRYLKQGDGRELHLIHIKDAFLRLPNYFKHQTERR